MDMYHLTGILKNTQYWVRSLHHKQGPVGSGMRTQEYGANLLEEMGRSEEHTSELQSQR